MFFGPEGLFVRVGCECMLQPKGYISLLTALALLALSLSFSVVVTYTSVDQLQSSLSVVHGARALALAEGCVEDALLQRWRDTNYEGGIMSILMDALS